jgi:hypothetical protein
LRQLLFIAMLYIYLQKGTLDAICIDLYTQFKASQNPTTISDSLIDDNPIRKAFTDLMLFYLGKHYMDSLVAEMCRKMLDQSRLDEFNTILPYNSQKLKLIFKWQ